MVGISGLSVVVISCHLRAVVLSVCQSEFVTPPPLLTLSINAEDSYCIAFQLPTFYCLKIFQIYPLS